MNDKNLRLQFSICWMLFAITVIAVCTMLFPFFNNGSRVLLSIFGLGLIFGGKQTRIAMGVLLPILYLPYAWLLLDPPYNDYRLNYWICSWFSLPMRVPARLMTDDEFLVEIFSAASTAIAFLVLIYVARFGKVAVLITSIAVMILSVLNSIVLHAMYSM